MRKALIVSYYFPPMNGPGAQHPHMFFRYLPEHGFETTAISTSLYSDESTRADFIPPGRVIYAPTSSVGKRILKPFYWAETLAQYRVDTYQHGFIPWNFVALRAAVRELKRERYSAIVSSSPSASSHWLAYRLKKRFPYLRWIADFQDPFAGNPFRSRSAMVRRWEDKIERTIFANADRISANTDTVQQMWMEQYPEWREKFALVWGGYDPAETIEALPLPDRSAPVITHVGGIFGARLPTALFDSVHRLSSNGSLRAGDFVMEFVGSPLIESMPNRAKAETLVRDGWLRVNTQYVPRPTALQMTEMSDMNLMLDIAPNNTKLQVPSKLFDYVRVGRPILAFTPPDSPTERILAGSGIPHMAISPSAPAQEVDEGLLRFLKLPRTPVASSSWFRETFDARCLAGCVANLIGPETKPA